MNIPATKHLRRKCGVSRPIGRPRKWTPEQRRLLHNERELARYYRRKGVSAPRPHVSHEPSMAGLAACLMALVRR